MEKDRWLEFLSTKVQTQISLENAQKARMWALGLLSFLSLGFALNSIGPNHPNSFLFSTRILFLTLTHLVIALAFYLPQLLNKGQKTISSVLSIRDYTSLTLTSLAIGFYSLIVLNQSFQAVNFSEMEVSSFLSIVVWLNVLGAVTYFGLGVFGFLGFFFFPQAAIKLLNVGPKVRYTALSLHATFFILLGLAYAELSPLGSPEFFEQFRAAGLFWLFLISSLLLIGKMLRSSALASLQALELDVVSGKLERTDAILIRFKDAFVSRRLESSLRHISHDIAAKAHEIAKFTHEAVSFVDREKPSELDLRLVEDRYRRAESLYRKLEKENVRFLSSLVMLDLSEVEREKAEGLRDQFSRELRNAKIELASVRKRIDERLVSIKNAAKPFIPEVPVEKEVTLSR
jgi:hypothetical protein